MSEETCADASQFKNIASVLRFFAESGRLTVVDKFGGALSPSVVRDALYDALRVAASLKQSSIKIKLAVKTKGGDEEEELKEYRVECCDYTRLNSLDECGSSLCGRVTEVEKGPESLKGKILECIRCPLEPTEEEVSTFLKCISNYRFFVDLTRSLAALAFSRPYKRSGGE